MKSIARSTMLAALLAPLAACAAATDGETTDSTNQAITESHYFTIDQTGLQNLLTVLDVSDVTLSVSNQYLTITPSARMVQLAWPGDTVANHTLVQYVPDVAIDGKVCGTTWVTLTGINVNPAAATVTLVNDHLAFKLNIGASAHLHTQWQCPDADVTIQNAGVEVDIGRAPNTPTSDVLFVQAMPVTVYNVSASCGIVDWCSGLVQDFIPSDLGTLISNAATPAMNAALDTAKVVNGVDAAINSLMAVNATIDHAGTPWQEVPGSLQILSSSAHWSANHMLPPVIGTCGVTQDCNGYVDGYCHDDSGDPEYLQRLVNGTWINAGTTYPEMDTTPPSSGTFSYRTCATNAAGTQCSASTSITLFPATGCGGGSGGGTSAPPCVGNACYHHMQ